MPPRACASAAHRVKVGGAVTQTHRPRAVAVDPLHVLIPKIRRGYPFVQLHTAHTSPHHVQGDKAAHNFLSEAVVRSLPQALSATERERVLASTPLSPTLNLLSSMPLVSCSCRGWGLLKRCKLTWHNPSHAGTAQSGLLPSMLGMAGCGGPPANPQSADKAPRAHG